MTIRKILKQLSLTLALMAWLLALGTVSLQAESQYQITEARYHGISFGSDVFDWSKATDTQRLYFLAYSYEQFAIEAEGVLKSVGPIDAQSSETAVIGKALVYPNPMSIEDGGVLGYELNNNADITLKIYDMVASEVFSKDYASGELGALASYNRLNLHDEIPFFSNLKSGVYFFLLVSEGKVVGKGKFLLRP